MLRPGRGPHVAARNLVQTLDRLPGDVEDADNSPAARRARSNSWDARVESP